MANEYQNRVKDEHKNQLLNQMSQDKHSKMALRQAELQDDTKNADRIGIFNSQFEQQRNDAKNQARNIYKQELDSQIHARQAMKAYGNMTNVEKELNKDELVAYKKYDNSPYTMVPGVTS